MSLHFILSGTRNPEVSRVRFLTDLCSLRVADETYNTPNGHLQSNLCQHFGHKQRRCGYAPRCVASGGNRVSGKCSTLSAAAVRANTTNYRAALDGNKWRRHLRSGRQLKVARKAARVGPFVEQENLGHGWNHVVRGGHVFKSTSAPRPKVTLEPMNKNPQEAQVASSRNRTKTTQCASKTTEVPKQVFVVKAKQTTNTVTSTGKTPKSEKLVPNPTGNPTRPF